MLVWCAVRVVAVRVVAVRVLAATGPSSCPDVFADGAITLCFECLNVRGVLRDGGLSIGVFGIEISGPGFESGLGCLDIGAGTVLDVQARLIFSKVKGDEERKESRWGNIKIRDNVKAECQAPSSPSLRASRTKSPCQVFRRSQDTNSYDPINTEQRNLALWLANVLFMYKCHEHRICRVGEKGKQECSVISRRLIVDCNVETNGA